MPWTAAAIVGGAVIGAYASKSSAGTQADAAGAAADKQWQQYQQTRADQTPWREAGGAAVGQLAAGTAPGGYFTHQFNADDLNSSLAPNYQFQLQQGQQANQNAAGVGGGLVGGNALQGLNKWSQDYAAGAYQQAYQNYTANQTNIYNRLSNLAGLGQTANQATSNAGMNAANQSGAFTTSGAAAQAAGTVGAANAIGNGINNYLGWNYLNSGKNNTGTGDLSWGSNSVTGGGQTYYEQP